MIYQNDICFHVNIIAEIGRLNSVNLGSLHEILVEMAEVAKRESSAEPQNNNTTPSVSARQCFTGGQLFTVEDEFM